MSGGEAIQALQDDQHPRLVHLVLRGMGEVGRWAGRLFRLFKMTSIPDWVHLVLRGVGEVGRVAGRLFRLFKMTSIPGWFIWF